MNEEDEAILNRRSERYLHYEFGLTEMVVEKVWRERLAIDDHPVQLNRIEREGLMVIASMLKKEE